MSRLSIWILSGVTALLPGPAPQRLGATFPIGEVDMLVWIAKRLKTLEQDGGLAKWQQTLRERVHAQFASPQPLSLSTTHRPTTFLVDPSVRLSSARSSASPLLRAAQGRWINPFDQATWPEPSLAMSFHYPKALVFFDGRDPHQREWATGWQSDRPIVWILTGGRPQELAKVLNAPVYFDQQGRLSRQLQLRAVPSVVVQAHHYWQVTEYDVMAEEEQQ